MLPITGKPSFILLLFFFFFFFTLSVTYQDLSGLSVANPLPNTSFANAGAPVTPLTPLIVASAVNTAVKAEPARSAVRCAILFVVLFWI